MRHSSGVPKLAVPSDLLPLFEQLQDLAMNPSATPSGIAAKAHLSKLVNAFTRVPFRQATLKNFGNDRVVFSDPPQLSHLPAVRILTLRTPADFEAEVHRLYHRRLEKMHEASEFLRKRRIRIEVDEAGFRVVGIATIARHVVRFSLREGMIAQILAIGSSSMERIIDARERRMDVRSAPSAAELEMILEPLVADLFTRISDAESPTDRHAAAIGQLVPDGGATEFKGPVPQFDYSQVELTDPGAEQSQPGVRPNIPRGDDDSGELIGLVCDQCQSFYLADPATPDYRLLKTCPKCLGG